ncbi:MAG: hypothetical protein F6J96_21420 [Symploca sp. SIO1C2]|nr:hypothetical protein [Symploca sp. SIO1C2]
MREGRAEGAEGAEGAGGAEERRSGGAEELGKKRELIIFEYKVKEIPPKISPHPSQGKQGRQGRYVHSAILHSPFSILHSPFPIPKQPTNNT